MSITVGGYTHHQHHYHSQTFNTSPYNLSYHSTDYNHQNNFIQNRFDVSPDNERCFPSWIVNSPQTINHLGYDSSVPMTIPHMNCTGDTTSPYQYGMPSSNFCGIRHYDMYGNLTPFRGVKRRVTANKKERRRTESINTAFANLRGCIPNVPSDTKLSKIKTLRLATSYISYLMELLSKDDPVLENSFKVDIQKKTTKQNRILAVPPVLEETKDDMTSSPQDIKQSSLHQPTDSSESDSNSEHKGKGRTGWPQTVWASELK